MKRAFVTGGSGFLGRNLIRHLRDKGVEVRALARSPSAVAAVEKAGAAAVRGDLDDVDAEKIEACDVVFHNAALADDYGKMAEFVKINVDGTQRLLDAAKAAGVARLVHTSTEAVLVDGNPLVRVDESKPLPKSAIGQYAITKGEAERRVRAANKSGGGGGGGAGTGGSGGMDTIIVRPRFIWGNDDSTLLPKLVREHRAGKLAWVGGGMNLTSTTHVDNVCHGLILAAEKGRAGETYFVTDGEPIAFRTMIERMLRTQNIEPPTANIPRFAAHAAAIASSAVWNALGLASRPLLPHMTFHLLFDEMTIVDDKARRELGYTNVVTRDEGLARMVPYT